MDKKSYVYKTGLCPYCRRIKGAKWKHSCNLCKTKKDVSQIYIVIVGKINIHGYTKINDPNITNGRYAIINPFTKFDR